MSQELTNQLHFLQFLVTLVIPPAIFAAVLMLFLGLRKLRRVVWP